MSEFLLVIPEGWTQLDWDACINAIPDFSAQYIESMASSGQLGYIQDPLIANGFLPAGSIVVEAKLIDATYFLVRLG